MRLRGEQVTARAPRHAGPFVFQATSHRPAAPATTGSQTRAGGPTMSHGRVRQFTWVHDGQKGRAWGFTVTIGGKRVRRQGYLSRAEGQDALDALKHPDPAAAPATAATLTLA